MHKISEHLQSRLKKLAKRDTVLYQRVIDKIEEITNSSEIKHYKNLRYDMKDSK